MGFDLGLKVGVEGEETFKQALSRINQNLSSQRSQLRNLEKTYDENDQSVAKLTKQQEVLNRQIDTQKQKLSTLKEIVRQCAEEYGENSTETEKWQEKVNAASAELDRLSSELSKNDAALEQAKQAAEGYSDAEEEAARAAEELERSQREAAERVAQMSDQLQKAAGSMQAVNTAALAAVGAVAGVGAASAKVGMDFEAQMSKVGAISGATAEEMEALTAKAEEMGASTKFTATESAEALEYMAMAGWKSQQMIDGLPGIMNLAAASGEDLASVSDIVTDALTAFGLQASDSAHFADVLAKASSSSNTNVALLGETFKYAAPVAGSLGYSVEDTAVAIGLMANAGIKGSEAGTALRGALTNLAKPSDQVAGYMKKLDISLTDTSGNVKPLNALLVDMRKKFAKLTDAQKAEYAAGIAGKEAMSGLLAVINASDADFNSLTKSIAQADGTAQTMADTMNDNLKGQLTLLGSAAESAGIAFYNKFAEPATDAVKKASKSVSEFSEKLSSGELDGKLQGIASAAAGVGTAIVGMNAVLVVKDIANFANAVSLGSTALQSYTAATKAGAVAQGALNLVQSLSPMGALAIAVGAVVTGLAVYANMTGAAETETDRLNAHVDELTSKYEEYKKTQDEIAERRDDALKNSMAEINHLQSMADELRNLTDESGRVNDADKERARVLANMINEIMPGAVEWIEKEGDAYVNTADKLDTLIQKEQLKAWLDANQESYQAAIQDQNDLISKITELDSAIQTNREHWIALKTAQTEAKNAGDLVEFDRLQVEMDETSAKIQEAQDALDGYETDFVNSVGTITQYESAKAAMLSDDETKIRAALDQTQMNLKQFTGANQEELSKQAADAQANYETLQRMAHTYPQAITETQLEEARRRAEEAKIIAEQAGKEETAAHAEGMESATALVQSAAQAVVDVANKEFTSAKDSAWQAGAWISEGLASGVLSKKDIVANAARDVASIASTVLNIALDEHSPSRITMKSGEYFDLGLAKGIEDNSSEAEKAAEKLSKNVLSAANEWLDDQKFYNKLAIGDEVAFWEQMLNVAELQASELAEVEKKLYTARADQSKDALDASKKWIEEQKFYNRLSAEDELAAWQRVAQRKNLLADEQIEAEKQLYTVQQQIAQDREKLLDEYEQNLDSRIGSLGSFAGLFDEIQKDTDVTGRGLLKNLKDQVKSFEDWQSDMEKLAEKGVTGPLLEELSELGPSAADQIHALSTLTEKELEEYADLYAQKTKLIAEQAQKDVGPVPIELQAQEIDLSALVDTGKINAAAATLSTTMFGALTAAMTGKAGAMAGAGAAAIQNLSTGMLETSPELQEKADQIMAGTVELADSFKTDMQGVGTNLMRGVAQGVLDGKSGVVNAVRQALEAAAAAARAAMDIHSPSKVFAEIGDYMAQGLGVGFVDQMRAVAQQISDSIPVPTVTQASAFERASEATVNGLAAVMQGGGMGRVVIEVPVNLDGREVTRIVADYLPQVSKQRGVAYG